MNRRSHRGPVEMNPTRSHEVAGSIPDLAQCVKDLALLWLWRRPAAAALIRPLAWEPPYAAGAALKRPEKKITENRNIHLSYSYSSLSLSLTLSWTRRKKSLTFYKKCCVEFLPRVSGLKIQLQQLGLWQRHRFDPQPSTVG